MPPLPGQRTSQPTYLQNMNSSSSVLRSPIGSGYTQRMPVQEVQYTTLDGKPVSATAAYSSSPIQPIKMEISKDDLAAQLFGNRGAKDSQPFVNFAGDIMSKIPFAYWGFIIQNVKKYPLKQTEFDTRVKFNIDSSRQNIIDGGGSVENADNSGPRKNYINNAALLREILSKYVWTSPNASRLSWDNIVRLPRITEVLMEAHAMNRKLQSTATWMLYSRAYFMVSPFEESLKEVDTRTNFVEVLIPFYLAFFRFSDIGLRKLELQNVEMFNTTVMSNENPDIQSLALTKESMSMNVGLLFKSNILPNPWLLSQSKSIRMIRKDPSKKNDVTTYYIHIAARMMRVMRISNHFGYKPTFNVVSFKKGSPFMIDYWEAYRVVHLVIRNSKSLAFGRKGGENTRTDEDAFVADTVKIDDYTNKIMLDINLVNSFYGTIQKK